MKILKGEKIYTKELCNRIGVSYRTFDRNKNKILEEMYEVSKFEIEKDGQKVLYHFLEDCDYIYKRKRKQTIDIINREKLIKTKILNILEENPYNTVSNIVRLLEKDLEIKELKLSENTLYKYSLNYSKEMFGNGIDDKPTFKNKKYRFGHINDKVWTYFNKKYSVYILIPEEEVKELKNMFKEAFQRDTEYCEEILSQIENREITKEEGYQLIGDSKMNIFTDIKNDFMIKYGYYPIKVPEYIVYKGSLDKLEEWYQEKVLMNK